ncbi:MAG TPA: 2,3-bisphosphoglycerate-independent phosphoglycerate mutase [Candidatus Limnocylindria bacterium]|nr:2,3-bisphosphoglycerate-independent phosphoglycerate mutase [Candidatus Limnocylindria bacterium]
MSRPARRVVLCVLDGFGLGDDPQRNALLAASMWNWRRITDEWPTCRLQASGTAVGLPEGQMGNSEVGHLNLGAGFPVLQDLPRINRAIDDGSFATNAVLDATVDHAVRKDARLHLLGLVGPGGIHAVDGHIVAMAQLAHDRGLSAERVFLHAFTDGRDTPPRSAIEIVPELEERLAGLARIATVSGRYYAMDRDGRWDRTKRAWDAIVHGIGLHAASAKQAVEDAYARGVSDEFIEPTVVVDGGAVADHDAVIHLNFRADRARQLTQALVLDGFDAFDRGRMPVDLAVATLTEYQAPDELPVEVAVPPLQIDSLAAELSRRNISQLHIAETEKYAHVTYFFNGGVEAPFPGEDRVLVPSNREVATYDQAPAMRAPEITDRLVEAIEARRYGFIVANYANPDMVGHTGVWDAAVEAAEVVDSCLGRLARATLGTDAALLITADHGNIEQMRDAHGAPQTKHTTSPVPLALVADGFQDRQLRDGSLADVAPTVCELLDIPPGPEMTGRSLLRE